MSIDLAAPPEQLIADLLPGEQAYPIYAIQAKWTEDLGNRDTSKLGPRWFTADGRFRNGAGSSQMPKEPRSDEELIAEFERERWPRLQEQSKGLNPTDLTVSVVFRRWETWCIGWFNHWTWDVGLSDSDVLESFHRYVIRTEVTNQREGKMKDGYWTEPYCLMGAEDPWRWKSDAGDPPCRCEHCKARGVVSIDH